jgi:hypothetical protein
MVPLEVIVPPLRPVPAVIDVTVPLFVALIVGLPDTPLPLLILMPVPAVIVRPVKVSVPVCVIKPVILRAARAVKVESSGCLLLSWF